MAKGKNEKKKMTTRKNGSAAAAGTFLAVAAAFPYAAKCFHCNVPIQRHGAVGMYDRARTDHLCCSRSVKASSYTSNYCNYDGIIMESCGRRRRIRRRAGTNTLYPFATARYRSSASSFSSFLLTRSATSDEYSSSSSDQSTSNNNRARSSLDDVDSRVLQELLADSEFLKELQSQNVTLRQDVVDSVAAAAAAAGRGGESTSFNSSTLQAFEQATLSWGSFVGFVQASLETVGLVVANKIKADTELLVGIASTVANRAIFDASRALAGAAQPMLLLVGSNITDSSNSLNISLSLLQQGINPITMIGGNSDTPRLLGSLQDFDDDEKRLVAARNRQRLKRDAPLPTKLIMGPLEALSKTDDLFYEVEQEIKYEKAGRRTNRALRPLGLSLPAVEDENQYLLGGTAYENEKWPTWFLGSGGGGGAGAPNLLEDGDRRLLGSGDYVDDDSDDDDNGKGMSGFGLFSNVLKGWRKKKPFKRRMGSDGGSGGGGGNGDSWPARQTASSVAVDSSTTTDRRQQIWQRGGDDSEESTKNLLETFTPDEMAKLLAANSTVLAEEVTLAVRSGLRQTVSIIEMLDLTSSLLDTVQPSLSELRVLQITETPLLEQLQEVTSLVTLQAANVRAELEQVVAVRAAAIRVYNELIDVTESGLLPLLKAIEDRDKAKERRLTSALERIREHSDLVKKKLVSEMNLEEKELKEGPVEEELKLEQVKGEDGEEGDIGSDASRADTDGGGVGVDDYGVKKKEGALQMLAVRSLELFEPFDKVDSYGSGKDLPALYWSAIDEVAVVLKLLDDFERVRAELAASTQATTTTTTTSSTTTTASGSGISSTDASNATDTLNGGIVTSPTVGEGGIGEMGGGGGGGARGGVTNLDRIVVMDDQPAAVGGKPLEGVELELKLKLSLEANDAELTSQVNISDMKEEEDEMEEEGGALEGSNRTWQKSAGDSEDEKKEVHDVTTDSTSTSTSFLNLTLNLPMPVCLEQLREQLILWRDNYPLNGGLSIRESVMPRLMQERQEQQRLLLLQQQQQQQQREREEEQRKGAEAEAKKKEAERLQLQQLEETETTEKQRQQRQQQQQLLQHQMDQELRRTEESFAADGQQPPSPPSSPSATVTVTQKVWGGTDDVSIRDLPKHSVESAWPASTTTTSSTAQYGSRPLQHDSDGDDDDNGDGGIEVEASRFDAGGYGYSNRNNRDDDDIDGVVIDNDDVKSRGSSTYAQSTFAWNPFKPSAGGKARWRWPATETTTTGTTTTGGGGGGGGSSKPKGSTEGGVTLDAEVTVVTVDVVDVAANVTFSEGAERDTMDRRGEKEGVVKEEEEEDKGEAASISGSVSRREKSIPASSHYETDRTKNDYDRRGGGGAYNDDVNDEVVEAELVFAGDAVAGDGVVFDLSADDVTEVEEEEQSSKVAVKTALKTLDVVVLLVEKVFTVALPAVLTGATVAQERVRALDERGEEGWELLSLIKKRD